MEFKFKKKNNLARLSNEERKRHLSDCSSKEEYQQLIDQAYNDEEDIDKLLEVHGKDLFESVILERDKHFAARIKKICNENQDEVIAFPLGMTHIFGNYSENLYNLLSDLNPTRIKLNEADKI